MTEKKGSDLRRVRWRWAAVLVAAIAGAFVVGVLIRSRVPSTPPPYAQNVSGGVPVQIDQGAVRAAAYARSDDQTDEVEANPGLLRGAIDVHEHVSSILAAQSLVSVMDSVGISVTCIVASPAYTLGHDPLGGFDADENNAVVLRIKEKWPTRFLAFVTTDPAAPGSLARLKEYVANGADGIKLYSGHRGVLGNGLPFHVLPLDDEHMMPLWEWLESSQLPVVLHVNLNFYFDELVAVLDAYPNLRISLAHFGVSKHSVHRRSRRKCPELS